MLMKVIFKNILDAQDMTRDTQKKSKRKGRNKQEVMTVSQAEPVPEAVKTPIDLMRVSTNNATLLLSSHLLYGDNLLPN